jgi:large repetitive protein
MKWPFSILMLVSAGLLAGSCDHLGDDVAPELEQDITRFVYASASGPSVFKLESLYASTSPFSIELSSPPTKGSLQMNPHGFMIYKPFASFRSGRDRIGYTVLQNGIRISSDSLLLLMPGPGESYPCESGAQSDSLLIPYNSSRVLLDVLANDHYCQGQVPVLSPEVLPTRGELLLDEGYFYYIPAAGFSGMDYFIYRLCQSSGSLENASGNCTYAYVALQITDNSDKNCTFISRPDTFQIGPDTTSTSAYMALDILANDELCGQTPGAITYTPPRHGQAYIEEYRLYYQRKKGYSGVDSLFYTLCLEAENCSQSVVTIYSD